jgi:2',3'-cyclic-nucleotide 2'-phosphodiesterase (5'-nucleotidase family)
MKIISLLWLLPFFGFLTFVSGCSTRGTVLKAANEELPLENTTIETAVIFASSDLEGNVLPSLHSSDGGIASLRSYYKTVQDELKEHVIWLDGGHLMSEPSQSAIFDKLGISATLTGNQTTSSFNVGNLKVGIVGLKALSSQELDIEQLKTYVEDQSNTLRKSGDDFIVLLTDLPISCLTSKITSKLTSVTSTLRKPDEPQGFCEGPLNKLIEELPESTVDAALVSGAHEEIHHFIFPRWSSHATAGVPVVSSSPRGGSVCLIYLSVASGRHKVVTERTRIEGPIAVQTQGHFHGKAIIPDPEIEALVAPLQVKRAQEMKELMANFTSTLELDPRAESLLTDFLADVIREKTHADAVIAPLGLVRNAASPKILAGSFSRADLDALFPVPIPIVSLEVRGDELKTLLKLSETGFRGFSSVSGLKLELLNFDSEAPIDNSLSTDDSRATLNRLLGTEPSLQSNQKYKIAVPLALLQGADDWEAISKSLKLTSRITATDDLKELVGSWLALNSSVNPPAPRLHFEKSRPKAKHRSRAKRRKKTH